MSDIEKTLTRISHHKGVVGCIILNNNGVVLRTTCEASYAEQHAQIIPPLASLARNMVRELDPKNDLDFLRIKSQRHEIMIAPRPDFTLIVLHDPHAAAAPEKAGDK